MNYLKQNILHTIASKHLYINVATQNQGRGSNYRTGQNQDFESELRKQRQTQLEFKRFT